MSSWNKEKEDLFEEIVAVKDLLGMNINRKNYNNMNTNAMYNVLEKYKKDFNKLNKNIFLLRLTVYKYNSNKAMNCYVSKNKKPTYKWYNAMQFNSYDEAYSFLNNKLTLNNGWQLINYQIEKLKF